MFTTASLARRIERAEAGLILECAHAAARRVSPEQLVIREMNGGVAIFVEGGSPFNKGAGPASHEPQIRRDVLDRVFGARGFWLRTSSHPAPAG